MTLRRKECSEPLVVLQNHNLCALAQRALDIRCVRLRPWFSDDHAQLDQVIMPETVAINAGEQDWENRDQVLSSAGQFIKGRRLTRLEFPRTELQMYGPIAVFYSKYLVETESGGKRQTQSGRATEVFVDRESGSMSDGISILASKLLFMQAKMTR